MNSIQKHTNVYGQCQDFQAGRNEMLAVDHIEIVVFGIACLEQTTPHSVSSVAGRVVWEIELAARNCNCQGFLVLIQESLREADDNRSIIL